MQIIIPAPTTYTKVDDGVYTGSDGNLYHDIVIAVGVYILATLIKIQLLRVCLTVKKKRVTYTTTSL